MARLSIAPRPRTSSRSRRRNKAERSGGGPAGRALGRLGLLGLLGLLGVGCTAADAPRPPGVSDGTTSATMGEPGTAGTDSASGTSPTSSADSATQADGSGGESSGGSSGGPVEPRPPGALSDVCFDVRPALPWNGPMPQFMGDITGDGIADALTVSGPDGGASVRVHVGRSGAGRWQEHTDSPLAGSTDVRLSDIDGDGALDVVHVGTSLVTAFGEPDGALTSAPAELSLGGFTSVALLDYDEDGKADAWLSTYDGRLETHRGQGNGTFTLTSSAQLADALDGTMLYRSGSGRASLGVMMGTAAGCLDCSSSAFSLLAVDAMAGLDLLGALEFEAQWMLIAPTVASVYQGDRPEVFVDFGIDQRSVFGGEGTMAIVGFLPNGPTAFGDLNGDGNAELVLLEGDTLRVYADGPREVSPLFSRPGSDVSEIAVADADGDGWDDVVLIDPVGYNAETGQLEPAVTVLLSAPCPG